MSFLWQAVQLAAAGGAKAQITGSARGGRQQAFGRMTDTPQALLAHHLKTLKLPTFLREYAQDQPAQCASEGVGSRAADLFRVDSPSSG